jgi:hypothetical protein
LQRIYILGRSYALFYVGWPTLRWPHIVSYRIVSWDSIEKGSDDDVSLFNHLNNNRYETSSSSPATRHFKHISSHLLIACRGINLLRVAFIETLPLDPVHRNRVNNRMRSIPSNYFHHRRKLRTVGKFEARKEAHDTDVRMLSLYPTECLW